jgi:RimJ/RimL family protein N-acetyltransferase
MSVTLSVEATASAPGLRLRPWRPDDAPAVAAAHRDPLLRRWLTRPLADEADARRWIDEHDQGWVTGTRLGLAVLECGAEERLAGYVQVKRRAEAYGEVGYWTVAEVRGRGVAPRAVEALSRWAFGPQRVMPVTRLDLLHAVGNQASCRVAEKCGFALRDVLPAQPPAFPEDGHLHVRDPALTLT